TPTLDGVRCPLRSVSSLKPKTSLAAFKRLELLGENGALRCHAVEQEPQRCRHVRDLARLLVEQLAALGRDRAHLAQHGEGLLVGVADALEGAERDVGISQKFACVLVGLGPYA